jgi:hypothetical protein
MEKIEDTLADLISQYSYSPHDQVLLPDLEDWSTTTLRSLIKGFSIGFVAIPLLSLSNFLNCRSGLDRPLEEIYSNRVKISAISSLAQEVTARSPWRA